MSDVTVPTLGASPFEGDSPGDEGFAPHVLDVLLRAGERADPSADASKSKVLEVIQIFGDAVVDLKHFAPGRAVALGATLVKSLRGSRVAEDFFVPPALLPSPTHPLFEAPDGGETGWVCVVSPEWGGFVEGPAGRRSIATLAALVTPGPDGLVRLPVGPDDQAVVHVGSTVFVARPVFPSKRVPVTGRDGIDYPLLGITGFMGFVTMMLGVALSVVPAPAKSSNMAETSRMVELLLQQPLDIPKPPSPAEGPAGERAKGKEGKRGEETAKAPETRRPLSARARDQQLADAAGVLGTISENPELAAMLGESGLSSALTDGVSALIGARATQNGFRGLGERGGGFGGGGTAELSAGLSVRGRGPGADGFRPAGGGKKEEGGEIKVDQGMITIGALDKALIDQVVKRNMAQIRYCYQRELTKSPSLGGKVTVKFVIGKDGSVSSASTKSSTLANAAVESCINARFMRFQFPEPKGGGIVVVSYPFLFSPG